MIRYLKGTLDVVSTLLVIVAASVLLWRLLQPAPAPPGARPQVEDVEDLSLPADKVTNVRGKGRVALIEFADYECPFCARHATETAPRIAEELIERDTIAHVFLNYPLAIHPQAQKAAEAAECAGRQGQFWEMHERLFENPRALDAAALSERAEGLGLDLAAFSACLDGGETAEKVKADMAEGRRLGVNSTPAFFVGSINDDGSITLVKRINGAVPFDVFDGAIEELLPEKRAAR